MFNKVARVGIFVLFLRWNALNFSPLNAVLAVDFSSLCLVAQSCPSLCNTWAISCQAPLSMGILQARILEWVAMPSSRGSSQTRSPALQVDSLQSELPGKPENIGMSSLSLLQGIFQIQELNWVLLHCRQILYQLSYPGSPGFSNTAFIMLR